MSKLLGRAVAGTGLSWVELFWFLILPPWNPLKYQHRNVFGHQFTHDQNMRFRLTKKHLQIQKSCVRRNTKTTRNGGNNDQLVKCKSFNAISIIRWSVHVIIFYFEWILLPLCYGCPVQFTYSTPLFRREFRRKRCFY